LAVGSQKNVNHAAGLFRLKEENMSGPKCSEYTINEEQRRRFSEILSGMNELKMLPGGLNSKYNSIANDLQKRSIDTNDLVADLKNFGDEITQFIENNSNINLQSRELESKHNEFINFKAEINKKHADIHKKIAAMKDNLLEILQESISKGFDLPGARVSCPQISEICGQDARAPMDIDMEITELKAHLMEMANHEALSDEFKNSLTVTINMLYRINAVDNLKNFKAITYSKIKKDYEDFIKDYEQKELARLLDEKEQEYIKKCLDEVMIEMGYDLLGDRTIVKKTGKQFKNTLYNFGNETVLNVTYASDGKISMEIGKADKSDRVPTSYEAERLIEEMREFCGDFDEIENKLKARGVLLKSRISKLPPTTDNAQVININDYSITSTVDITATNKRKTKNTAKSSTGFSQRNSNEI